jgi:hypothetical protein
MLARIAFSRVTPKDTGVFSNHLLSITGTLFRSVKKCRSYKKNRNEKTGQPVKSLHMVSDKKAFF